MRNYIHINLSISLMIAQLTFVTGVDKTKNEVCTVDWLARLLAKLLLGRAITILRALG